MSAVTPPPTLPVLDEHIPDELKAIPQWVCWRWSFRDGKWTKPPVRALDGGPASHSDAATWAPYSAALRYRREHHLPGIGLVLTEDLGIVGFDGDKCRNAQTGAIDRWCQEIIDQWASYSNASPTQTGIRVFAYGHLPTDGKKRGPIEIYRSKRYLTVTGHRVDGTPATLRPAQAAIDALYARVAGDTTRRGGDSPPVWTAPCSTPAGDLRARAAAGRIRRATLALLDTPGQKGESELDMQLACGLVGAGLTADEVLALILDSVRGQSAADRKGSRYVDAYWKRTVENAAEHVGPVAEQPSGLRLRFTGAGHSSGVRTVSVKGGS
jgi:hypothetical protein